MIAVDTNILVYAHRSDLPEHGAAAARMRELAEGPEPWILPWPCIHEFLATVTNRRIFPDPTPMQRAAGQVAAWLSAPSASAVGEAARHWQRLVRLLDSGNVDGPRVHDARIAAICLEHGIGELWSADRDFGRFPALRVRNPLVSPGA